MVTEGAVVVTGASSGIGKACAIHLDGIGYRIFAGVRAEADGHGLKNEAPGRLTPLILDVTDGSSVNFAARVVADAVGTKGLHGLVNNAGVALPGPLEFLPIDQLRRQLEVNIVGQLAVTQAFLPLLRTGRGRIVNIGSISGRIAVPLLGSYSASKFAMEALTDTLRLELRPWGIPVSIVEPGVVATPIWQKGLAAGEEMLGNAPPQAQEFYGASMAAARISALQAGQTGRSPSVVAKAVAHALTARKPRTRYVVGRDARLGLVIALLPDRARDWIIARTAWRDRSK